MGRCSAWRISKCSENPPCSALIERKTGGKRISCLGEREHELQTYRTPTVGRAISCTMICGAMWRVRVQEASQQQERSGPTANAVARSPSG
jgi:hypothetical protein